jgi:N-acetylglucosamine kinase-like BadF-type ATPase
MSSYLGVVGGCSGSYAILVEDKAQIVVLADDDRTGMDWRESRTHGDPGGGIQRLRDRIVGQIGRPLAFDGAAVAISGADPRYWPSFHRFTLKHAGFDVSKTAISSLAEAAYWGALPGQAGILVRSGHGSSIFGSDGKGLSALVGGWGSIVGDCGSASWLGCQALDAFCKVLDRRASPEMHAFAEDFTALDGREPMEVIEAIEQERYYIGGFGVRKELFFLGLRTLRLAELGDKYAELLGHQAVAHLAEGVLAAYRRIGEPARVSLALAGSTFARAPAFAAALTSQLENCLPARAVVGSAHESVYWSVVGIATLAIRKFEQNGDEWIDRLHKSVNKLQATGA